MSCARIEEGNVSNRYLLPSWFQLMNDRSQLCFSLFNRMEQNTVHTCFNPNKTCTYMFILLHLD